MDEGVGWDDLIDDAIAELMSAVDNA